MDLNTISQGLLMVMRALESIKVSGQQDVGTMNNVFAYLENMIRDLQTPVEEVVPELEE